MADFRDGLTNDVRYRPAGLARLWRDRFDGYEASIVNRADLVTFAVPSAHRAAIRTHSESVSKLHLLTNGYPDAHREIALTNNSGLRPNGSAPHIVIVGTHDCREIQQVLDAIEEPGQRTNVVLTIAGPGSSTGDYRVPTNVEVRHRGYVHHADALAIVRRADVCLHLLSRARSSYGLSSRLFEYIAADKPILSYRPTADDVRLLDRYERSWVLGSLRAAEVRSSIDAAISGTRRQVEDRLTIERFSRRSQAERVVWLAGELVSQ